jgi:PAS domain S-box-containing protein
MEALHPDDLDRLISQWTQDSNQANLNSPAVINSEGRLLRLDGSINWFYVQIVPEIDQENQITGYIGTLMDITARKQAKLEMQKNEQRDRALIDGASDEILLANPQDNLIDGNQKAEKLLSYGSNELKSLHILNPDGSINWFYVQVVPEIDDENQITSYIGALMDITARKQAELELQKYEHRYRVLMDAASDAILLANPQGNLIEANLKAEELLGYSRDELKSLNLSQIHPPDALQAARNHFKNVQKNNFAPAMESLVLTKDGSQVPVEITGSRIDIDGVSIAQGIFRDIRDRKQAEQENQQLRERLQFILSTSPAVIFTCRPDGDYGATFISDNIQSLMGYTPEEYLAKSSFWADHVHPDDAPHVFAQVPRLFEQGIYSYEYRFQHQDGHYLWIRSELRLIRNSQNIPIEIVGYYADISDRKQLELELAESEAKFRRLVEGANDLIWSCDANSAFTYLSPQFKVLFGWEPSAWIGKSYVELIHPDDIRHVKEFNKSIPVEFRHQCQDGRYIWVRVNITPIFNSEGVLIGSQGVLTDITDRKKYEQQLEQTNAELLRATRLKDEFLATMSHELRTPLNAILGMTEALQEEVFGIVNERQIAALQTVERSSYHLLELINDILDLAKIEAGQVELNYEATAIAQLCQSSMLFIKEQSLKKQIQLEMQIAPNLPDISLDERRIRQVLINLLNNAVKFTPEGGQIRLEVDRQEDQASPNNSAWLRFSIIDTGIGIAPENIQKLFQPFIQIDSALNRKYEGTGLGLALVKQIVDLHGGKVSLTSELSVGSCFVVDIPYKNIVLTPSESQTQINLNVEIDKPEQTRSPLILIAEDNQTNIDTISDYLVAKGYRLLIARDGAEAIALTKAHHPDIILMDIQMPVMDGLEAIKQIRLDPSLVDIPIIALTALAMTGDRDRCLAAGANEYLSKPVKLKELAATIQKML